MKKKDRQAYIQIIKPMLTEKRFEHSLNVAQEAVKLAKKFGADPEKAETAGILHDILKDTPADKQLKIISDFGIIMSDVELSVKKSWHAISGAAYIRNVLHIEDAEIVDAVRYHTTGRHNMTVLEKVVFVADFISKDRDYPGVEDAQNGLQEPRPRDRGGHCLHGGRARAEPGAGRPRDHRRVQRRGLGRPARKVKERRAVSV